jgi:hypothetical protein
MKAFRYPLIIATLIAIIFLPYWIYIPLLFLAILFFPFFWEGILLGFLIDVLYGSLGFGLASFIQSFSFWAFVLLLLLLPLRKIIRAYA